MRGAMEDLTNMSSVVPQAQAHSLCHRAQEISIAGRYKWPKAGERNCSSSGTKTLLGIAIGLLDDSLDTVDRRSVGRWRMTLGESFNQ
jgi:hypothetical protein